jgi:hypothetical protein
VVDAAAAGVESGLDALRVGLAEGAWAGTPNALSSEHVEWPAIDDVAIATRKMRVLPKELVWTGPEGPSVGNACSSPALHLIRSRRSAVHMDGTTALSTTVFFAMLERLQPRRGVPPWDVLPWAPRVHPVFFVHRVDGLPRGLYLLGRARDAGEVLRGALRPSFAWKRVDAPGGLPLFLLEEGEARPLARFASCQQEVAADSAFAVAMIADLRDLEGGPWWYRRLHWEAGVLGQVLYMEAEAAGVRGTGIGCFFDEVVHETLGLEDRRLRDLYHFTVGGAVDDRRLTTTPGYGDAVRRRA